MNCTRWELVNADSRSYPDSILEVVCNPSEPFRPGITWLLPTRARGLPCSARLLQSCLWEPSAQRPLLADTERPMGLLVAPVLPLSLMMTCLAWIGTSRQAEAGRDGQGATPENLLEAIS
eukprot:6194620-Pleurochrysis_carterae.AAC.3